MNQKVIGYCRVSTIKQDLDRQKLEILEYANRHNWRLIDFVTAKVGSKKSHADRGLDKLKDLAGSTDVIIFSELSRFGRSVGEISRLVNQFIIEYSVELHFIKENMILRKGQNDIGSKVTLTMFSLLAEIERDLISERTKSALAARRLAGVRLGRPKMKSKLDIKEDEIKAMVQAGIIQKRIAANLGCTEATLCNWLKRKKLEWAAGDLKK